MRTLTYIEIENNFPKILDIVKSGEEIGVSTEKGKRRVAVIVPYEKYQRREERPLGILKEKGT